MECFSFLKQNKTKQKNWQIPFIRNHYNDLLEDCCLQRTNRITNGKPSELLLRFPSDHVDSPLRPVSSSKFPELVKHCLYCSEALGQQSHVEIASIMLFALHKGRESFSREELVWLLSCDVALTRWLIKGCVNCTLLSPLLLVWSFSKPPRIWFYAPVFSLKRRHSQISY